MAPLTETPLVVSFADWVWGADPSELVSPEICLSEIPLLSPGCFSGLLVKGIGIGIIFAACLNKAPIIRNILKTKSAAGFTQWGVYSDTLVVCNCAFYGILNNQPITAYGENVALALQSIVITLCMWNYKDDPPVTAQQKLLTTIGFVLYIIGVTVFLPEDMYYLLMATVWPLALISRGSIIVEAMRLKHMGANSVLVHIMNCLGSSIRILTTIKEIGWDFAMLSGFFLSLLTNGIIILQFWLYRDNTAKFVQEHEKKKKA